MANHLNPARDIVDAFGGVDAVAQITGRDRTSIFRWMYPKSKNGTGGAIPRSVVPILWAEAKARGLPLTAESFLEVEAAE